MANMPLYPVGQRPVCLTCRKELRPNFKWIERPFNLSEEALRQWKQDNPRQFLGTYGGYGDNLFCGLGCGYQYAVHRSKKPI